MAPEIFKQVEFAKSHSNIDKSEGACIFKGKKVLVIGFSHLPSNFHYTSEESIQVADLHISAIQDIIIKIGSYRKVTYADLEIALSFEPSLHDVSLIIEMGFKKLWIPGEEKALSPDEYFRGRLKKDNIYL